MTPRCRRKTMPHTAWTEIFDDYDPFDPDWMAIEAALERLSAWPDADVGLVPTWHWHLLHEDPF